MTSEHSETSTNNWLVSSPSPVINSLLDEWLEFAVSSNASDLHLSIGESPFFRIEGELVRASQWQPLTAEVAALIVDMLCHGRDRSAFEVSGAMDGAFTRIQNNRFRFNIFREQARTAIAIRILESRIRNLDELGLPSSLYELSDLRDGLVIVSGPTSSGKSTTLATLIDRINDQYPMHVITIEDPIEYLHESKRALVHQRQVGTDAGSFQEALVASLRQDPDVILVGEIRDLNTIRTAITAAETGHLVFTTVHAGDAVGVIERLVSVFPANEQPGVRQQLGLVLKAVISQHLIIADGPNAVASSKRRNRVVASEILRVTPAVSNLIANSKSAQIYSAMESGTSMGMQTFDQSLAKLVDQGYISRRTATAYSHNPSIVEDRLRGHNGWR